MTETTVQEAPLRRVLSDRFRYHGAREDAADVDRVESDFKDDGSSVVMTRIEALSPSPVESQQNDPLQQQESNEWQDTTIKKETATDGANEPLLPETDCSTASTSSEEQEPNATSTTPPPPPSSPVATTPIYNPFSNYSPASPGRTLRREVHGISVPLFSSSRIFSRPNAASKIVKVVEEEEGEEEEEQSEDKSEGSDDALEQWAQQIRTELRHSEMVELAVEAERAAESGLETFTAKLSTYGHDDSLVMPTTTERPMPALRPKSFSEGTKVQIPQTSATTKLGVMSLRDVNEVFPPFGQFHEHLRTHFARIGVNEKALKFHESKKTSKGAWDDTPPSSKSHRRRASDFFKPHRTDFFRHQRNPSDLFLNFDRWVHGTNSIDSSDSRAYGDLLANHEHTADDRLTRRPKVVVPPGLELPDLDLESCTQRRNNLNSRRRRRHSEKRPLPAILSSPRQLSPDKALFDHDDEADTDQESVGCVDDLDENETLLVTTRKESIDLPPPPPPIGSPMTSLTPVTSSRDLGADFQTPARLRVIRDSIKHTDPSQSTAETLLLSGASALTTSPEALRSSGDSAKSAEVDERSSIMMPRQLGLDVPSGRSKVKVGIRPRPSNVPFTDERVLHTRSSSIDDVGSSFLSDVHEEQSEDIETADEAPSRATTPLNLASVDEEDQQTPPPTLGYGKTKAESHVQSPERHNSFIDETVLPTAGRIANGSERPESAIRTRNISRQGSEDPRDFAPPSPGAHETQTDCGCLTISPETMCSPSSAISDYEKSIPKPQLIKRSSSAGALASMDSPSRNKWNPFSMNARGDSTQKPFQAAINMFTRISPKNKNQSKYMPATENDAFLDNFLYRSKPKETDEHQSGHACAGNSACVDVAPAMCCASFFPANSLSEFMASRGKRAMSSGPLLSLGGDQYSRMEPETWFDMANERFDGMLEHLIGRAQSTRNAMNVSFQAPALNKKNVDPPQKERAYSIVDDGLDFKEEEEKKLDDDTSRGVGRIRKHARHLSYFPTSHGSQYALSDNQFETIYGLSPEDFADSISRNLQADESIQSFHGTAETEMDSGELDDLFDPLEAAQTF